jgi:F-type H+-transporting ATPase subunit alpha
MRQVAGRLRIELSQYRELAAFAQFGTAELDASTRAQLERGRRITEVLKQNQYSPMPTEKQVLILYVAVNGHLDDIAVERLSAFESEFLKFIDVNYVELKQSIAKTRELGKDVEEKLKAAIQQFKSSFK